MFLKYTSIENSYRKEYIERVKEKLKEVGEDLFCVQEKIHGANFSFTINKNNPNIIIPGSKNDFLPIDENSPSFYNHISILNKYKDKIQEMFRILSNEDTNIETLIVYGELFGGTYPHKDVEKVKRVKRVQSGIFYTPDNEFLVFDIIINGNYISLNKVENLCNKVNIPFDPILFTGTFEECLEYPNNFESKIPQKIFNLPIIEDNICEGTVIKPLNTIYLNNGKRIIVKNKNKKWKEKIKRKASVETKITNEGQILLDELFSLVTESRFYNVISKVGDYTDKDFGKILGLYSKDVMEEFNKDFSLDIIEDNHEKKKIKRLFQEEVKKLLFPLTIEK